MVVKKGPEQAEVEDIVSEEDSDALSDEDDSGDESDDFWIPLETEISSYNKWSLYI